MNFCPHISCIYLIGDSKILKIVRNDVIRGHWFGFGALPELEQGVGNFQNEKLCKIFDDLVTLMGNREGLNNGSNREERGSRNDINWICLLFTVGGE